MELSLNFVVCKNTEVVGNGGEFCDEVCLEWIRDVKTEMERLDFVGNVRSDSHFPNWNGGKYAHQSKMYGYDSFGNVVCTGGTREIPLVDGEEGERESVAVEWADLTVEEKSEIEARVWSVIEAANKQREKSQVDIDKGH